MQTEQSKEVKIIYRRVSVFLKISIHNPWTIKLASLISDGRDTELCRGMTQAVLPSPSDTDEGGVVHIWHSVTLAVFTSSA